MNTSKLEQQLIDAGFARLFLYSDERLAEDIWQNGTNKEVIEQVISTSSNNYAKFLAAEMLRRYHVPLQEGVKGILAEIYSEALHDTGADNRY